MLLIAGSLNRQGGGPGVRPPLPAELKKTLLRNQWNESPNPADHTRRSIYVFARRNLRYPIFEAFDRPDANASCARRNRSTTAPQSLMLLNGQLSLELSRLVSKRLQAEFHGKTQREQVGGAFQLILARAPSAGELAASVEFLSNSEDAEPAAAQWDDFCLALLNSNAFVYVD